MLVRDRTATATAQPFPDSPTVARIALRWVPGPLPPHRTYLSCGATASRAGEAARTHSLALSRSAALSSACSRAYVSVRGFKYEAGTSGPIV